MKAIHDFWFAEDSAETLGLFRIFLGLFVLLILVISNPGWERYYGVNGVAPLWALTGDWGAQAWSLFSLSDDPNFIWRIYWVMIGAALFFTFGLCTRLANAVLFVCYISMMYRNLWMVNGQDQVISMLLFFGCFAPLGACYSIDSRLTSRDRTKAKRTYEVWSWRLLQISFAMIYLFAGPSKIETWLPGDAIYYVSYSEYWFRFPSVEMFHNIYFSKVITYSSLVIESAFPLLICFGSIRYYVVGFMMLFHLMIMILLAPSVFYFNFIMLVGLLLYLSNEQTKALVARLLRS